MNRLATYFIYFTAGVIGLLLGWGLASLLGWGL
jgi:hypothetical protein